MKRFNHFSPVVLRKVSLELLSRAFCTLLLIAGVVAPGVAQSIYVANTAGVAPTGIGEYSPTGAVIDNSLLSFPGNGMSVPSVAYSGGNLYVALNGPSNGTVVKYNANTGVLNFHLQLPAEPLWR